MTPSSMVVLSRAVVTVGLLVLAGWIIWANKDSSLDPLVTLIVGGIIGYWLSHAENQAINAPDTSIKKSE